MTAVALHGRKPGVDLKLPPALDRRFEAVIFDWDGDWNMVRVWGCGDPLDDRATV